MLVTTTVAMLPLQQAELIGSLTHKLEILKEAKEGLLTDIKMNNALGEEVELLISTLCKPNEFDKYKMFIGDLDKVVNLLLSLSGRLARVENVLSSLGDNADSEERVGMVWYGTVRYGTGTALACGGVGHSHHRHGFTATSRGCREGAQGSWCSGTSRSSDIVPGNLNPRLYKRLGSCSLCLDTEQLRCCETATF